MICSNLAISTSSIFCIDFIKEEELKKIIEKSYLKFREDDVVKITNIGQNKILELFHGPTLAFKDIEMQLMGNLYKNYYKQVLIIYPRLNNIK